LNDFEAEPHFIMQNITDEPRKLQWPQKGAKGT
jgi:hypothetical protein